MGNKLNDPTKLIVGYQYIITEPIYDESDLGIPELVEVVTKTNSGYVLKSINHGFTYSRTFSHLNACEIEENF
jgi:hypothetical protein